MSSKARQYEFLDWEFGVFFHFGIRTFYEGHHDWDLQEMDAKRFDPAELDCSQWVSVIKKAGAKYAILVCKHHDGFANWPSAYTRHSVAGSPWKGGKGDVVREYVDACREGGIKVGLYYSPAEFGSSARAPEDHDGYFINQVSELLTNYGKIDYLWFDGNGSSGHKYDSARIVAQIRRLQPEILLFNMWDPDTRWAGNESGYAHYFSPPEVDAGTPTVHVDAMLDPGRKRFLPVECDVRMRRRNWFYSDFDEGTVKSVEELMGIYDYSVGRGANFLINISPNRQGLLPKTDSARLIEFGDALRRRFENPIPAAASKNASVYAYDLESPMLVTMAVLEEEPDYRADGFIIEACPYESGDPITVYAGRTIGHKAICSFPPFYTMKVSVSLTGKAAALRNVSIYGKPAP